MSKYKMTDRSQQTTQWTISACTENVTLANIEYVSEGNWECLDFTFEGNTPVGVATLKSRVFKVDPQWVNPNPNIDGDTKAAAVTREETKLNTMLFHIAKNFGCTEDQLNTVEGNSFREYAEAYAKVLLANCTGVMVYLKTIPNKNGYATLPKYPPFVQNMATGDCVLKYSKKEESLIQKRSAPQGVKSSPSIADYGDYSG